MKKLILFLAMLGGFAVSTKAVVSGPDNVIYGTITLGGTQITAANSNYFVAARLQANGQPIATYTMGSLPSAGNYYSLRISVESVGAILAPNAVQAGQLIYVDVDDQTGIRAQTSFTVKSSGQMTLLNFGSASIVSSTGSLSVSILPPAVALAGALWQVDGGTPESNGSVVSNLSAGAHTVSFTSVTGWVTPPNQTVNITNGTVSQVSGIYTQPNGTLTLLTNGYGIIQHSTWPKTLVIGTTYKVTAVPNKQNVFVSWVGGTVQPYGQLSTSAAYSFVMQSNLVLEANFMTNALNSAIGTYRGLFGPTNITRLQNNSGAFLFTVNKNGVASGNLAIGSQNIPFSGQIGADGSAAITTKSARAISAMTINLQIDFASEGVIGTVSNSAFVADLVGNRDVFSSSHQATAFEGQYTLVIAGTTNPSAGPLGNSFGTVKVSPAGAVSFSGSLADGTTVAQSSAVSKDGYWPLYVSLYNGKGSLWGWNYFASHTLTAPVALSWINATNSNKAAADRAGFTNQAAALSGGIYVPGQTLPSPMVATLLDTNAPFSITVTNTPGNTAHLLLKTNKSTGVISGTFANPSNPKQKIKVQGIILQGQTNAQGYFLINNQSGSFDLDTP
jgi:hypothetical protein